MRIKSIVSESRQIQRAIALIKLKVRELPAYYSSQ